MLKKLGKTEIQKCHFQLATTFSYVQYTTLRSEYNLQYFDKLKELNCVRLQMNRRTAMVARHLSPYTSVLMDTEPVLKVVPLQSLRNQLLRSIQMHLIWIIIRQF